MCLAAAAVLFCSNAACADGQRRAGDVLRFALPASTLGVELARGEVEGAREYAAALAVSLAAGEVLKRTTHVERPDHTNDQSFPSGHAVWAFSAATYVHRRHGFESAWPLYLAASYVGYTRVQANRHRWIDVAGGAVIAGLASCWMVKPKGDSSVGLPSAQGRGIHVAVALGW
jgi:membrane-associated phospholipid phosphatase